MKTVKYMTLIFLTTFIVSQAFSQIDNCLDFDGTNDYVLVGDVNDLGTSDFTIEAWFYVRDSTGAGRTVLTKGITSVGTPPNAGYGLRLFDNQITSDIDFHIGHSDGSVTFLEYNGITLNVWYHIAAVRSGKYIYLYLDGVLVASDSTNVVYDVNTDIPLAIGAINKGGMLLVYEFMDGKIDEVRIWSTARTAVEINDNKDCAITSGEPNLVAVYNFNEGVGFLAADSSGFNNNGSLENGTLWANSPVAKICLVGINENEIRQTNIYPNPFQSEIQIDGVFTNASFKIFDVTGRIIKQGRLQENRIDAEGLTRGNYILEVSEKDFIIRKRIVKD